MGKKKEKMKKYKQQRQHAKVRFIQRLGITLSSQLHDELVRQIQKKEAKLIEKQSNRVSVFMVDVGEGREAKVVYDKNSKNLVTVLLDEYLL